MLLLVFRLLATVLHAGLIFGLAPLLMGMVNKFRARLLGRSGPVLLQPYRDLWKLMQKVPLIPDTATELYKYWPFVSFVAIAAIGLLVPGFSLDLVSAHASDFITIIGLFALSRAAVMLAGLETGSGFGGAGAGREALFAIFSEAALLVVVLVFGLIANDPTVDGIAVFFRFGQMGISVSVGFALAATLAVALTETGRIPVDNPAGHLELGMVHEAMLLEYSGRYLALFNYTACLRLMLWFCLVGTVFLPFGMAEAGNILSWPLGLVSWLAKLCFFAAALAFFEVSTAKMRIFRVPEFLGVAMLLGLLSAIFLFVAGRLGA
jgi:formate hydrogenlyase subunit 4